MLKTDESFWLPTGNAAELSWGSSKGDVEKLWQHTERRWKVLMDRLDEEGFSHPSGRVLEFGAGMGLTDKLLDNSVTDITMLDHTRAYLDANPNPLSERCHFVQWGKTELLQLQEKADYDWCLSLAVFYHIDTATAVSLLLELGKTLKVGGKMLIYGWYPQDYNFMRREGINRLFTTTPNYYIDPIAVMDTVQPELKMIALYPKEWPMMVFQKDA